MTISEMDKIVTKVAQESGIELSGIKPALVELAEEMLDRKPVPYKTEMDFLRIYGMDEGPMERMLEAMTENKDPEAVEEWAGMLIDNGVEWDPVLSLMAHHSGIPRELFWH